ncbi:MAG: hypothetical protein WC958_03720 [Dehalococcoidales bacterium]
MNTSEYQNLIFNKLSRIFGEDNVKKEWDSLKYDTHSSNHKQTYGPRLDIAVGPFNGMVEMDTPFDNTNVMKNHPLTKRIVKEISWDDEAFDECWNDFSRCYLAIEIELGGKNRSCNSSKHILGSIINASVNGAIGIVIYDTSTRGKVDRLYGYLHRLRYYDLLQMKTMGNLIRLDKDEFISILTDIKE